MSLFIYLVPVIMDVLDIVPQDLLWLLEFHERSDVDSVILREESQWHVFELLCPGPQVRDLLEEPDLNGLISSDQFLSDQQCGPRTPGHIAGSL